VIRCLSLHCAPQLLSQLGEHTVYVQKRKGIIKLALRHGVPLVPCYCFGETSLYRQSGFLLRLRQAIASKLGVAITLPLGRSWLLPLSPIPGVRLVQYVGTPIPVDRRSEPTQDEIDALHRKYVAGLQEVFERHKAECGCAGAKLVIA
jgi:1-acyl-sn-glycerol-3-phosphate acyltransferase